MFQHHPHYQKGNFIPLLLPLSSFEYCSRKQEQVAAEMQKTLHAVVSEVVPVKNLRYFADYFDTCRQIAHAYRKNGKPGGNSKYKYAQMRLAQAIEFLVGVRFLFFYLRPIEERMELVYWYDTINVMHLKPSTNAMAFTISMMMCYLYECFYFQNWGVTGRLLHRVMIRQQLDFFDCKMMNGKPIYRIVQQTGLAFLNAFQIFVFVLDCFGVTSMATQLAQLYQHRDYFADWAVWGPPKVLFTLFNTVFFFVAMLNFAHCCILTATLSITSTRLIFVKLTQLTSFLQHRNLKLNTDGRGLLKYFRSHTETLRIIVHQNRIYGMAFFAYLLITMPLNALLTLSVLLPGKVQLENRIFLGFMAVSQFIYIFGIHLMCAIYTKKIHSNSRRLIHLNVLYATRMTSIALRLKLASYIEKFHTKNCYGISYGKFALITFIAFAKYLMFYAKFLIITYKNLTKGRSAGEQ